MLKTTRLKVRDYWIYPQPIRSGDWRVCKARPYNRAIQRQHIKPNRFAWKLHQEVYNWEHIESGAYLDSEEYFDEEENGFSLAYWAMDVPELCGNCSDRNICIDDGCEYE